MSKIKVRYFAALKEEVQRSDEVLDTLSQTPRELFTELQEKYHLKTSFDMVRIAINQAYVTKDCKIKDGDEIVFIPPVAGG